MKNTSKHADELLTRSVVGACPLDCPDGCSWIVDLENDQPVTLRANRLHPFTGKTRAREGNGALIVTIDPTKTATAKLSDIHVSLKPGTDAALIFGIINQIVARGQEDQHYLKNRTLGWDEFRDKVIKDYPLERTAAICGTEPELIVRLAELISTHGPTGIKSAMGIQHHRGGGQAVRALSCLPAVCGDYQKLGGGMCY